MAENEKNPPKSIGRSLVWIREIPNSEGRTVKEVVFQRPVSGFTCNLTLFPRALLRNLGNDRVWEEPLHLLQAEPIMQFLAYFLLPLRKYAGIFGVVGHASQPQLPNLLVNVIRFLEQEFLRVQIEGIEKNPFVACLRLAAMLEQSCVAARE